MNDPNPHNASQTPDPRGSRWFGFGLFWLTLVGGGIAAGILASVANMLHVAGIMFAFAGVLPWAVPLVLAIWLANKGKTHTAQGIVFGFLSLFAVGLLLVAACFGIIALNGLGSLH